MIWYLIGGLIGIFLFKKKYHLSIWSAIGYGIGLTLCVYFGIGALTGFVASSTGLDEIGSPWLFLVLFIVVLVFFILNVKKLQSRLTVTDHLVPYETIKTGNDPDNRIKEGRKFKKCPFCAEYVLEEAVYCRYCKHDLSIQESISEHETVPTCAMVKDTASTSNNASLLPIILIVAIGILIAFVFGTGQDNQHSVKPQTLPTNTPTKMTTNALDQCHIRESNGTSQVSFFGDHATFYCRNFRNMADNFYTIDYPIDSPIVCSFDDGVIEAVIRDSSNSPTTEQLCYGLHMIEVDNNQDIGLLRYYLTPIPRATSILSTKTPPVISQQSQTIQQTAKPTLQPTLSNPVLDITIKVANYCPERNVVIFEGPVHLKYDVAPGQTIEWQGAKGTYSWTIDGVPGQQSPMDLYESVWTLTLCYSP